MSERQTLLVLRPIMPSLSLSDELCEKEGNSDFGISSAERERIVHIYEEWQCNLPDVHRNPFLRFYEDLICNKNSAMKNFLIGEDLSFHK